MLLIHVAFSLIIGFAFAEENEEISECLKKCLLPLAKMERSFNYVFNNYEKVCDILEKGAWCSKKCSEHDQHKFHQYSTFYRIYCVDYEEDLEPHLDCLKTASKEADDVCKDRCRFIEKREHQEVEKDEKMKHDCRAIECSTVCYFQELAEDCPDAKNSLLKLNVGQIHSIANTIHPVMFERMTEECRLVHNTDYMKKKMLDNSESITINNLKH